MTSATDQSAYIEGFFNCASLRGYDTTVTQELIAMTLGTYAVNAEGLSQANDYIAELSGDSGLIVSKYPQYRAVADRAAGANLDRVANHLGNRLLRATTRGEHVAIRGPDYAPLDIAMGRLNFRQRRLGEPLGGGSDLLTMRLHGHGPTFYDVRILDDELLPLVRLEVVPSYRQRVANLAERLLDRLQITAVF